MAGIGVFGEDQRVELLDGEVFPMAPIGSNHGGLVAILNQFFVLRLHGRMVLWPRNALRLGSLSVPQPDVLLLRPRPDFYRASLPEAADVLLLIEVADTPFARDRRQKERMYSHAGVTDDWLAG